MTSAFVAEHSQAFPRENENLPVQTDLDVFHVGADGEGDVGYQGPGCGGPYQKIGVVFALDAGFDIDRGIIDVAVAEGDFVGRQRRAASGAVKLNPEPLIDETVPEEGIQCPPHRFDVFVLRK